MVESKRVHDCRVVRHDGAMAETLGASARVQTLIRRCAQSDQVAWEMEMLGLLRRQPGVVVEARSGEKSLVTGTDAPFDHCGIDDLLVHNRLGALFLAQQRHEVSDCVNTVIERTQTGRCRVLFCLRGMRPAGGCRAS